MQESGLNNKDETRLVRSASLPLLRAFTSRSLSELGHDTSQPAPNTRGSWVIWDRGQKSDLPILDTFDVEEANALKHQMRAEAAARRIEVVAAKLDKSMQELADQCNIRRSTLTPVADMFGQRDNCPCSDCERSARCTVGHGIRPLSFSPRQPDAHCRQVESRNESVLHKPRCRPVSCCTIPTRGIPHTYPGFQEYQLRPISRCSTLRLWDDESEKTTINFKDDSVEKCQVQSGVGLHSDGLQTRVNPNGSMSKKYSCRKILSTSSQNADIFHEWYNDNSKASEAGRKANRHTFEPSQGKTQPKKRLKEQFLHRSQSVLGLRRRSSAQLVSKAENTQDRAFDQPNKLRKARSMSSFTKMLKREKSLNEESITGTPRAKKTNMFSMLRQITCLKAASLN